MELIYDVENSIKDQLSPEDFLKSLRASKMESTLAEGPETPEPGTENESSTNPSRYPTFSPSIASQLLDLLRAYFVKKNHLKLEKLLLSDEVPDKPLVLRGFGNQLADAFKQLFDARLIVGCQMADLERWITPKFNYLSHHAEARELTKGYLNGLMSTKTRPCKSPILKIEQKDDKFYILPTPRNKR
ncbi:MAG: hypothetical protein ACOH2A_13985 [Sphingobacteriaceae bacterium]